MLLAFGFFFFFSSSLRLCSASSHKELMPWEVIMPHRNAQSVLSGHIWHLFSQEPPGLETQSTPASRWLRCFILTISEPSTLGIVHYFFELQTRDHWSHSESLRYRAAKLIDNYLKVKAHYSLSGSDTWTYGTEPLRKYKSALIMTHKRWQANLRHAC